MRLGALLGPIVDPTQTQALAEQARTFAGEGFDSLWSAQAIGRGFMFTDPFVALTVAATVAEQVEIGTAVLQVPLYQSIDLAHRVFSLQQICGDRFIFGVGAGSTANDFTALGRDYERFVAWRGDFGDFDPFGDFELLFPAATLGLGCVDIAVRYRDRTYGTTSISRFRHGWQLLKMTAVGLVRIRFGAG